LYQYLIKEYKEYS